MAVSNPRAFFPLRSWEHVCFSAPMQGTPLVTQFILLNKDTCLVYFAYGLIARS